MANKKTNPMSSSGKTPQNSTGGSLDKAKPVASSGKISAMDLISKKGQHQTMKQPSNEKLQTVSGPPSSPRGCPQADDNVVRLLGTDSTGRFLEVPQIVPIYLDDDNSIVPMSVELDDPDEKTINFLIPRGTRRMVVNGWYAIPFYIAETGEVEGGYRRLVAINPDQQHELGWDLMEAGPVPPAVPYTFRPGFQAGSLLRYGFDIGNYPLGAYHHAHCNYHYRMFPIPMELPAGAQGKITIQRSPNTDKWFKFFPDTKIYLFIGLIGRRVMEIPPPFNMSATKEPTSMRAYGANRIQVPTINQIGQLGRTVEETIKLTDVYPSAMDELIFSGELDGLFMKANWYNGMMSLDWLPAMLFHFRKAGGRNIAPIFVEGNTEIQFQLADGVRLGTQEGELERIVSIDLAGGIYGW